MIIKLLRVVVVGALLATSGVAVAASPATTTFAVTATVAANCIITSASAMAFGTYTPGTGNIDQTSTILLRCSSGTAYGIGLSEGTQVGTAPAPTTAQRTMGSPTVTGTVNYNLYTNVAGGIIWLNPATAGTAPGNQFGAGTGMGIPQTKTHTVFGRLADDATSQAATPASDYTSVITVNVNY